MGKTLIIAEAGANHNRHFYTAIRLIEAAVEAGADYSQVSNLYIYRIIC